MNEGNYEINREGQKELSRSEFLKLLLSGGASLGLMISGLGKYIEKEKAPFDLDKLIIGTPLTESELDYVESMAKEYFQFRRWNDEDQGVGEDWNNFFDGFKVTNTLFSKYRTNKESQPEKFALLSLDYREQGALIWSILTAYQYRNSIEQERLVTPIIYDLLCKFQNQKYVPRFLLDTTLKNDGNLRNLTILNLLSKGFKSLSLSQHFTGNLMMVPIFSQPWNLSPNMIEKYISDQGKTNGAVKTEIKGNLAPEQVAWVEEKLARCELDKVVRSVNFDPDLEIESSDESYGSSGYYNSYGETEETFTGDVKITTGFKNWDNDGKYGREYTLYHEVGHGVYNLSRAIRDPELRLEIRTKINRILARYEPFNIYYEGANSDGDYNIVDSYRIIDKFNLSRYPLMYWGRNLKSFNSMLLRSLFSDSEFLSANTKRTNTSFQKAFESENSNLWSSKKGLFENMGTSIFPREDMSHALSIRNVILNRNFGEVLRLVEESNPNKLSKFAIPILRAYVACMRREYETISGVELFASIFSSAMCYDSQGFENRFPEGVMKQTREDVLKILEILKKEKLARTLFPKV